MKGAIDNAMNVANGTKVLLIDTFMNYFNVFSEDLLRKNFGNVEVERKQSLQDAEQMSIILID